MPTQEPMKLIKSMIEIFDSNKMIELKYIFAITKIEDLPFLCVLLLRLLDANAIDISLAHSFSLVAIFRLLQYNEMHLI